jgi:hypothetical protein
LRWWIAPAIVYVAMVVVFLAWSPASRGEFPLDDAWIHRVYARSLAWGHGFAHNDAQEAGCTSPLWAVISAPLHWLEPALGVDALVWAVKLLGAALGALASSRPLDRGAHPGERGDRRQRRRRAGRRARAAA